MTNYPDPVAAAIGELSNYADAVDQLGESVQGVFEHGGELVESRRRLASLLESSARELADLMEERDRRARLHAVEMREATRRREVAEHRAATLEQTLRTSGVFYAPGDRVRIGAHLGTVVPDAQMVRVRLDGTTATGRFPQEFVHHLAISDAEAADQVQDAANGAEPADGPHKAEELARLSSTVHTVRRLADVAAHWPFNKGGHLWQAHEKRDFAKWLREMANKINKGEEW